MPIEAGALVEMPIDVDEALRVGAGIVRPGVNDLIGVVGAGDGDCGGEDEKSASARETHGSFLVSQTVAAQDEWIQVGFVLNGVSKNSC
jgi:hypothetical protein